MPTSASMSIYDEALAISDRTMTDQLVCHTLPTGVTGQRFLPCGENGRPVATLREAERPVQQAFAWLQRRGLAHLEHEGANEVVVLTDNGHAG